MKSQIDPKSRILNALRMSGITELTQICPRTHKMYPKLYRQLWTEDTKIQAQLSFDTAEFVLEQLPEISADYIMRAEGPIKRTVIYTPPTHRQDIHLEGGTAAISQNGDASIGGVADAYTSVPAETLVRIIQNNDMVGMVSILMRQQGEIARLRTMTSKK